MFEHVKYLGNSVGCVAGLGSVQLLQTSPHERTEYILRGRLCQDFHGYGVIQFVTQSVSEACRVVDQIVLSRRSQKNRTIDFFHVRNSDLASAMH